MKYNDPKMAYAFEMYCVWRSLPKHMHRFPALKIQDMGFSSEQAHLLSISCKTEFAKAFCVPADYLLAWEGSDEFKAKIDRRRVAWAQSLTPSVLGKLYEKIMEEGDASRIKLWKEWVDNKPDTVNVDLGYSRILEHMKADGDIKEPPIDVVVEETKETDNGKESN